MPSSFSVSEVAMDAGFGFARKPGDGLVPKLGKLIPCPLPDAREQIAEERCAAVG